jgi:hypothetical protein
MAALLPPRAAADLVEWGPESNPGNQFQRVLAEELSVQAIIAQAPSAPALTDDLPLNEYFLLRRYFR